MLDVVRLEGVRGGRRLFQEISFQLMGGELLYLQGRNGSGKTSLLRMLCGLSSPTAGEIRWRGEPIGRLGEDFRRELCFLGHHDAIKEALTPLENLTIAARLSETALDGDAALAALAELGLAAHMDLPCRHLSRGQKRRVALARLVGERRALWLLDEPFVALDPDAVDRVAGLIGAHLRRGGLAVLTTHQPVEIAAGVVKQLVLDACCTR